MGIVFQSFTALTELLSWEKQACYNLKGQRPLRVCKTWKGSWNAVRVLNSFGAQEANMETKADEKEKLLIDCGPDQQCVLGGIVALGKFDALHIGHRELAIQAAKTGVPFLLSFAGMAEVLGWEKRLPVVAKCDRRRVLSLWAPLCGGANYRFGYKASGDASDLVHLCGKYGLKAYIVDPVMDKYRGFSSGQKCTGTDTREKGQVSSTLVRKALAAGNIKRVEELLGRKHRLMLTTNNCIVTDNSLLAHSSCVLNQPPKEGEYGCMIVIRGNDDIGDSNCNERLIGYGDLRIDAKQIEVTLHEGNFLEPLNGNVFVGLEFAGSKEC